MVENFIKISLIIPVYNVEKYLDECLKSVSNQTLKELEIICIDDASKDSSFFVLQKWAKKDSRILVLQNEINRGLSYTRNRGLLCASGEFVYFVDSDDYLYNNSVLECGYNYLQSNNLDGLLVDADVICDGRLPTQDSYNGIRKKRYFGVHDGPELTAMLWKNKDLDTPVWRQLWRRTFLTSNQLWFEDGIIHEDFLFTLKAVLTAHRLMCINDVFYVYRKRANSITQSGEFERLRFYSSIKTYYEMIKFTDNKPLPQEIGMFVMDWLDVISYYVRHSYLLLRKVGCRQDTLFENALQRIIWSHAWRLRYKFLKDGIGETDFEEINKFKYLLVYGAGKIGIEMVDLLSEYDEFCGKIRVAVTEKRINRELNGIPIHWIGEYKSVREQCVIIIAVSRSGHKAVIDEIEKHGFPYYIDMLIY